MLGNLLETVQQPEVLCLRAFTQNPIVTDHLTQLSQDGGDKTVHL